MCLVLSGSLAACGSPKSTDQGADSKTDAKTKITYWTGDRHDSEFVKETIATFNETNQDNIEVELVIKGDDFDQALDMSFQTSEPPDVIRVKENTIQTFYKKGFLAPIDEFLTDEMKEKFPVMEAASPSDSYTGTMSVVPLTDSMYSWTSSGLFSCGPCRSTGFKARNASARRSL